MTEKKFYDMVLDELKHLKENATPEEIAKLKFDTFNHANGQECIYGQMTGSCISSRAKELYSKHFKNVALAVTNEVLFNDKNNAYWNIGYKYTALERYLFMIDKKAHNQILNYLKGQIDDIKICAKPEFEANGLEVDEMARLMRLSHYPSIHPLRL